MQTVADVVQRPESVMGAKAVFGSISSHVLCFGSRGERHEKRYLSVPAGAARRAVQSPWVFAIGGGGNAPDALKGRVLNLVRASCVYGPTDALVVPQEARRLAQWPVAIALHDVWELTGHPHLVADLGLPNRLILAGAQDGIVKPEEHFPAFWDAVRDWPVNLRALPLDLDFHDSGQPTQVHRRLPVLSSGSEEGLRAFKMQLRTERDRKLAGDAKALNREKYGTNTCEACEFGHSDPGMFDAHHPNPICAGVRTTMPEHLIVLCPTCHRRAHRQDRLVPYTLDQLRAWISAGRP